MDINFIVHLKTFFYLARKDPRLSTSHLSLYMALFDAWNSHRFINPFYPTRNQLMATSRIGSNSTYAKTMEDLHRFGYIKQEKLKSKFGQSLVTVFQLGENNKARQLLLFDEQAGKPKKITEKDYPQHTKNVPQERTDPDSQGVQKVHATAGQLCTPCVAILYPLIHKHINNKKRGSKQAPAPNISIKKIFSANSQTKRRPAGENCTLQQPIESPAGETNSIHATAIPLSPAGNFEAVVSYPALKEITCFFLNMQRFKNEPPTAQLEAAKFYNHYKAIGWKLGGNSPIQDWKAAARKWVLNMRQQRESANAAPATFLATDKNYSEPL